MQLARLKFELANRNSAGGKTCSALTSMYINGKDIAVRQIFSLKTALNIHKQFIILKTISDFKGIYMPESF